MKPTIGRIVHFVINENKLVPAIITNVINDTCVNLRVFHDGSNMAGHSSPHEPSEWVPNSLLDENDKPSDRTWHWPPKV